MNILVLAQRVPFPPNKGEKIRTYHQIKYLREQGHQVHILAVQHDEQDVSSAQALQTTLSVTVVTEPVGFQKARMLAGLLSARTLSVCNFRVTALQKRLDDYLQTHKVDVVLCTGSAMASYVFANEKLAVKDPTGPILIMDFMDLDSDKWTQYVKHSNALMAQLYRREARLLLSYEKRINQHFDHCLFVTANEVDLFNSHNAPQPDKLKVVGNGVDMQKFPPAPASAPESTASLTPDLLFVGVMDYLPNEDAVCWFVDTLWADIRKRWPEARFSIVGMTPSVAVRRLGNVEGIEVTGKVESVLPYFHRANGFTSDSGAEGIECHHEKHLLIADSAEQIMQALVTLMNEPRVHRTITDNALALVEHRYSWDGQNAALLRCLPYEKAVSA